MYTYNPIIHTYRNIHTIYKVQSSEYRYDLNDGIWYTSVYCRIYLNSSIYRFRSASFPFYKREFWSVSLLLWAEDVFVFCIMRTENNEMWMDKKGSFGIGHSTQMIFLLTINLIPYLSLSLFPIPSRNVRKARSTGLFFSSTDFPNFIKWISVTQ